MFCFGNKAHISRKWSQVRSPMSSEKPIVVFGSIVQDLISYTDHFPRPGESVRGNGFHSGGGGKGANQAVAAAKLGGNVHMIARVGNDMFGEANIKGLRESGVNVEGVEKSDEKPTATASITVNAEGENSIVVVLGANELLDAEAAEKSENIIKGAGLVIKAGLIMTQAEICNTGNRRIFEIARKHGVTTFFNPAPGDPKMDKSVLSLVDIVCTNENEAEFLTGLPVSSIETARAAAARMLEMGPEHAIITIGGQGVVLASKGCEIEHITVPPTKAVDTTGAGDCFCGSFAAFYVRNVSVRQATSHAAKIAALSVTRKGTQSSYWSREEILQKYPDLF